MLWSMEHDQFTDLVAEHLFVEPGAVEQVTCWLNRYLT
jgi:hypothetical protein